jgi:prepilin-type processing-associated H-X9-DG protein
MRASCANNLKQLGLVVKMFENEHDGYTPGGWLSCYPEYLSDSSVLTSPKDEPGTDSYLYLLPATNVEAYASEAFPDLVTDGNPAGMAKAMSEIPLATNRTDFPGETPVRNVLFADGHVEYMTTATWREKVLPYVQRPGN